MAGFALSTEGRALFHLPARLCGLLLKTGVEWLAIRFQEPDVSTHDAEMGTLPSLDPKIHGLGAHAKEPHGLANGQRGLSHPARGPRHHVQHEPPRQLLRQRGHGSWFPTVKSEEADRFESYAQAKEAMFDYIEVFYNQRRRHSTLGQISPARFEREAVA